MDFLLFVLVNATLFIRPAEIVPALEGLPIYNVLISACLVVSFPKLVVQLSGRRLAESPIGACVLGLLAAVVLSHLSHLYLRGALEGGLEFSKVALYYFVLCAVLDTPARFRGFLRLLVGFTAVLTALALLQYHGAIDIPALQSVGDAEIDPDTGVPYSLLRLCSTGIYHDPNDLSLILLVAMGICAFEMGDRRGGLARPAWLALILLFGYALTRTHSRGGFLALLAATGVLFVARFGVAKAIPLAMVGLPVALYLFGGRQTAISTSDDTGQDRIRLWAEGLALLRGGPVFGIGQDRYADEVGLVAHNSFVHAFTELGFFGGTLFLGAFSYAITTLHRLGKVPMGAHDPELGRFRPYLLAILAAYAAGMLTISRNYIVPTYMVLGLASAYLRLASEGSPVPPPRLGFGLIRRLVATGLAFLAAVYLFVRIFARFGG